MSAVVLAAGEEVELYVLLKPREDALTEPLAGLLRRIEKQLFDRLTIEEMESLSARFPRDR